MKDLTKLLSKGNLTPRERVLLVIKNEAHRQKTGKDLITDADICALTVNWKPADYKEAGQYNKYLNVWDRFQRLEMDMQTNYLSTQLAISRLEHIAAIHHYTKDSPSKRYLAQIIPDDHTEEFRSFFLQNTGFEYDRLTHLYTFFSLPKKLQQDILLLDPEVEFDHSYLLDEEQLANILTGKQSLTEEEIDDLTNIIMNSIPWGQELNFNVVKISVKDIIFRTSFAGYPLINFAKRLATRHGITYETEDELHSKVGQLKDLKHKLKDVVHDAVEEGLFFDEYIPLCNSTGYVTFEGKTKVRHAELMKSWIKAKVKTTQKLQEYIDSGELVLQNCPTRFFEVSLNKTYVTGESLEQSNLKLPFVLDYQTQVDDLLIYGYSYFLIQESYVFENYQYLLAFKEIARKMSEVIDMDVSEKITKHLDEISESINTFNFYLRDINDHILKAVYDTENIKYSLQTFLPDPCITLQNLLPKKIKHFETFEESASKLTGWGCKDLD